jgi:hypothetical protein
MIDTRTVGQEIQDQVLAAARKGQQRVQSTVKTVTATAAMIRPQLPALPRPKLSGLPKPTLTVPRLPTPGELREKAPDLTAMLPTPEQLRASAQEFAEQILTAQRKFLGQVRSVATPLAHQAAAALAQAGISVPKVSATKPTPVPHAEPAHAPEAVEHGKAHAEHAEHGKAHAEHGKVVTARNGARTAKPKARTTTKATTK